MKSTLPLFGLVFVLLHVNDGAFAAHPKCHPYVAFPRSQNATTTTWNVPGLCKAYNFPTKLSATGVIGILEFGGGYLQSDLDAFSRMYGMPRINVTNVSLDGTTNNPGVDFNADAEVTVDIQCSVAAYYYATGQMPTVFVFFSNGDFISTFAAAVNAKCDVLSISWGNDERIFQLNAPGYAAQVEAAAQQATAAGLVIFAAAGDFSSSDEDTGTNVDLPAACPHVIGCGGTAKTISTETVWGDGVAADSGTGGGYSTIFPVQSFQVGAPAPPHSGLGRMVPDLAADADPNTGIIMILDGQQIVIGGTSIVSPLYSGLFAALGKKLGFVTPKLWSNRTAFVDIVSGSNGAYHAAVGPDPCTGVGVPNGTAVYTLFRTSTPTPSNVTASFVAGTLTLTGDANPNSLTVSFEGGILKVEGANGTKINSLASYSSATPTKFALNVDLGAGDDGLALIGVNVSTASIRLGAGNDKLAVTLSNISSLTLDGGDGTDAILSTSSKYGTTQISNVP